LSGKAAGVFKKSFLGGFNRTDVLAYFDKVSYQHEQDKKEFTAKIASLEEENKRLSDEMLACSAQIAKEQEYAKNVSAYANGLRTELSRQQFLAEEKNNEIQLQKSLCTQLQHKAAEYEDRITALEQHKIDSQAAAAILNDELAAARTELSRLSAAAETDAAAIAALRQEKETLSAEKAAAETKADALSLEIAQSAAAAQEANTSLRQNLELAIAEKNTAEDQVVLLTALLSDADQKIAQLTASLEEITAERNELEQQYREAVAAAETSAASLAAVAAEREDSKDSGEDSSEKQLTAAKERIHYIDSELASFKDEIRDLRRLTVDSLNNAEKKLTRIENSLGAATKTFDTIKNVAESRTELPQKRTSPLKSAGSTARTAYLTAKDSKNTLFDTVTTALDALVARWSR